MSTSLQYVIVFIILGAVIGWTIYRLVRKKPGPEGGCPNCALSETCRKKDLAGKSENKIENCNRNR